MKKKKIYKKSPSNDFVKTLKYLKRKNIEFFLRKINNNNYEFFAKTNQKNIVLYIQIINLKESHRDIIKIMDWNLFVEDMLHTGVLNPPNGEERYSLFEYHIGDNIIDLKLDKKDVNKNE